MDGTVNDPNRILTSHFVPLKTTRSDLYLNKLAKEQFRWARSCAFSSWRSPSRQAPE
jgi:hypothetical protein